MIVVLDTNVLVSGTIKPGGPSAAVLRLVANGRLSPALDSRIFQEYREVLSNKRFGFVDRQVRNILELLDKEGIFITPSPINAKVPDPDDLPFMEVAVACRAQAIITGNKKHFPAELLSGIKILSPAELLGIMD